MLIPLNDSKDFLHRVVLSLQFASVPRIRFPLDTRGIFPSNCSKPLSKEAGLLVLEAASFHLKYLALSLLR